MNGEGDPHLLYIRWRNSRPRFEPGPRERALGFKGKDLRHEDGRWFNAGEARAFSEKKFIKIRQLRGQGFLAHVIEHPKSIKRDPSMGYVYFLWSGTSIKIGFSKNPFRRATQISTHLPQGLTAFAAVPASSRQEKNLHHALAEHNISGEWFHARREVVEVITRSLLRGTVVLDPAKWQPIPPAER